MGNAEFGRPRDTATSPGPFPHADGSGAACARPGASLRIRIRGPSALRATARPSPPSSCQHRRHRYDSGARLRAAPNHRSNPDDATWPYPRKKYHAPGGGCDVRTSAQPGLGLRNAQAARSCACRITCARAAASTAIGRSCKSKSAMTRSTTIELRRGWRITALSTGLSSDMEGVEGYPVASAWQVRRDSKATSPLLGDALSRRAPPAPGSEKRGVER